jgi:uncharacterized protein YbjT (DUF2867 family)
MREQLQDSVSRLVLQPDEDVSEVNLGIDVVALARGDERVEDHEAPSCTLVAEEE